MTGGRVGSAVLRACRRYLPGEGPMTGGGGLGRRKPKIPVFLAHAKQWAVRRRPSRESA